MFAGSEFALFYHCKFTKHHYWKKSLTPHDSRLPAHA